MVKTKKIVILILGILLVVGLVIAADSDGDGVEDNEDNCYNYYNPSQEDSNSDGIGDACDIVEHTIYLNQGWNLISFPLNFGLITAKSLNETLNGALDSIYFYYRNDTYQGWKYFIADAESNTLNIFDPSYGFWMKVKDKINLTLRAPKIYTATQKIYAGWNLIGYPGNNMSLENTFGDELTYLNVMFVYGTLGWSSWRYNRPVQLNGFNRVVPRYGIWMQLKEDRNWTFEDGIIS